jgi:hypothetical protein
MNFELENNFNDFCDKHKITYSIKPYAYDAKRNVIDIPKRFIYSNCVMCIGNCFIAEKYLNKPMTDEMTNYLTIFSGNDVAINNIIEKVYSCINKIVPEAYLIVFITYNQIYFQIIDKLFEKYVLLSNKAYTTHILFCIQRSNINKNVFEHEFKEYELNDENLFKIAKLYKNKYAINQRIQNMYYDSHDNGAYYIKGGSFGDPILEFELETNGLKDVYIKFNGEPADIAKLDNIVKMFNMYKKN